MTQTQLKQEVMDTMSTDLEIGINAIKMEADGLHAMADALDENFTQAVEAIDSMKKEHRGRLIVAGIGKSGHIAKKLVATLASTGTPSHFVHPGEASHGDLGMIQSEDLVLCISKSGETPEIKVLVPMLKTLGTSLIGMVSNKNSYLAQQADFVLHTPVAQEADPNNLAPTASTTAQMVMGDCIATALLQLKGFSPKDFAQYHPGGSLGKQLYLRVSDLYILHEKPVSSKADSIQKIILEMTSKRLGATVVTNENNNILGIITDGDLRRMLEKSTDFQNLVAKDIMKPNPKMIQKNEMAVKALEIMRSNSISQIVVVDGDQYLGIVHLHDLLKEGII